jgi:hypothetical protein
MQAYERCTVGHEGRNVLERRLEALAHDEELI